MNERVGMQETMVSLVWYGLSLIPKPAGPATKGHRLSFRSAKGAGQLDLSRCQFVNGDALTELRKLRSASVNVVICSPPYWPLKRWYGGHGIGFEPTVSYITNLVAVFREVRRVLKKDGVLWVVIGDSYTSAGENGDRMPIRLTARRNSLCRWVLGIPVLTLPLEIS